MKMDDGQVQTGDTNGEPRGPQRVNLTTAPGSRNGPYEVPGALRAWPARARLRDPARKRSTSDTSRPRGRLKWRRVLDEFGTRGFPRGRVCGASHAAYRVFCSWNAWSGLPGRRTHAGLHGKPRRLGARVTSSAGISRHECRGNSARWLTWGIPRERALVGMCRVTSWLHRSAITGDIGIAKRDERASRKPPPWRCRKKKKPRSRYMPRQRCGKHPVWAKEALVSGMG